MRRAEIANVSSRGSEEDMFCVSYEDDVLKEIRPPKVKVYTMHMT